MACHWRFAAWNGAVALAALLIFGFERPALVFAAVLLVAAAVTAVRLRARFSRPLAELTASVRRAAANQAPLPAIARGADEIQALARAVNDWSSEVSLRLKTLSDARFRLESILAAMVEGVLVFDRDGRIILANGAAGSLLEVRRDLPGKTCLEAFRNELLDQAVRRVLAGEPATPVEFQTSAGRTVRALPSPVTGGDPSQIAAALMVFHDLTDIRQLDRVRRDFVANVSHEFKTPLTSIRGYAETMMSEPEKNQEFLEIIERNARHLESLVNDLLALSRMESEPPSSLELIDLQPLVLEQVALRGQLHPIQIEVDCPALRLRADASRLAAALSNLIDNAIRYNRPSGRIRIAARSEGPHVLIAVSDTGYGIPEEELPRIFERFYRVDKSRTRARGGTGLGLAIARHAVESQGGLLSVESRVGTGSTFTIRLPLAS